MAQLQSLSIKGVDIIDYIYPVGIYQSFSTNFDPNTHFEGTTWERVYDAFLYSVPQGQTANVTGGEKTHTLTVEEMPEHRHPEWVDVSTSVPVPLVSTNGTGPTLSSGYYFKLDSTATTNGKQVETSSTGGGVAHNNMPPYQGCYTWRRTA